MKKGCRMMTAFLTGFRQLYEIRAWAAVQNPSESLTRMTWILSLCLE